VPQKWITDAESFCAWREQVLRLQLDSAVADVARARCDGHVAADAVQSNKLPQNWYQKLPLARRQKAQVLSKMRMQQSRRQQKELCTKAEVTWSSRTSLLGNRARSAHLALRRQQRDPFSYVPQRRLAKKTCPVGPKFVQRKSAENLGWYVDATTGGVQGDHTSQGRAHAGATNCVEAVTNTEDAKSVEIKGQDADADSPKCAPVDASACLACSMQCVDDVAHHNVAKNIAVDYAAVASEPKDVQLQCASVATDTVPSATVPQLSNAALKASLVKRWSRTQPLQQPHHKIRRINVVGAHRRAQSAPAIRPPLQPTRGLRPVLMQLQQTHQ